MAKKERNSEPTTEEIFAMVFVAASLVAGKSRLRDEHLAEDAKRFAREILSTEEFSDE